MSQAMSLASLDEDILLLVCLETSLADITSLRQVCDRLCRVLCEVTQAKVLWIKKLEETVRYENQIAPHYLKKRDLLDAAPLEALVRRMSTVAHKWVTRDLCPIKTTSIYLPQSITWLRLVAGTWLFVASSDNHSSKISCWDLSLVFKGYIEPLAEAYLPGQVKTGKLEVHDLGVVIALGLGEESLSVHIITLRQQSGSHSFSELCRIEGSSHVLMLHGNLVGCGVRHGAILPHLVNWRNCGIHDIPPPPGGLDIPGRRSVPHLLTIWSGTLVIVRTNAVEFYALPLVAGEAIVFTKLIKTPTIWEAAICDSAPVGSTYFPSLRLVIVTPLGIEMCVIDYSLLASLDENHPYPTTSLAKSSQNEQAWYHLCIGQSGRRTLWISEPSYSPALGPQFMSITVPLLSPGTESAPISWGNMNDDRAQPALWAIPAVDFDDVLGLTITGNCFGELAIHDHGGGHPELCGGLAIDFTDQRNPIPPLLSTMPIPLGLHVVPMPPTSHSEMDLSIISRWSQDNLDLAGIWSTQWFPVDIPVPDSVASPSALHPPLPDLSNGNLDDWDSDELPSLIFSEESVPNPDDWDSDEPPTLIISEESVPNGYWDWDRWQGFPNDFAWLMEHAYGFPGPVIPQAYDEDPNSFSQRILFRSGHRYFVFNPDLEPNLRSWALTPSPPHFHVIDAQPESLVRQTAITEGHVYRGMLSKEIENGRNRWIEQAERGGRPHNNLLMRR